MKIKIEQNLVSNNACQEEFLCKKRNQNVISELYVCMYKLIALIALFIFSASSYIVERLSCIHIPST